MLKESKEMVETVGFNPYRVPYDNRRYIDLASNNYLGLAEHPRVKGAAVEAIEQYGVSFCGTPVASGHSEFADDLARRLAGFVGMEAALLFPSCYQANNGVFAVLCGKEDLIVIDKGAHSSLVEGARMAGCKISPFLHNDLQHLEKVLRRSAGKGNIFVVTESVFSTEGSIAPLPDIVMLCRRYGAVPVVDDSHGIGVLGEGGHGILEHFRLTDFPGIYTASLGKALGNMGGMVAGNSEIMERLEYLCPNLVYSTALTPPVLGGLSGALEVIDLEYREISKKMWFYKDIISHAIGGGMTSETPINTIFCGDAKTAITVSGRLYERGVLSTPFIEPSVPKNNCVVRLIAGAGLEEERVYWAAKQIQAIIL